MTVRRAKIAKPSALLKMEETMMASSRAHGVPLPPAEATTTTTTTAEAPFYKRPSSSGSTTTTTATVAAVAAGLGPDDDDDDDESRHEGIMRYADDGIFIIASDDMETSQRCL